MYVCKSQGAAEAARHITIACYMPAYFNSHKEEIDAKEKAVADAQRPAHAFIHSALACLEHDSLMAVDLSGKHLALLKEAVPKLSRVALVVDTTYPFKERIITSYEKAAQDLGLSLWPAEISGPADVEPVFAKIVADRADGFALTLGGLLFNLRARIGASALAHHLPGICFVGEEVPDGLLMSYGQDFPDFFRRAAGYVDKILKGAKPADLPVEQPTKFKLLINLKTAKALGFSIPTGLLSTADEVIE